MTHRSVKDRDHRDTVAPVPLVAPPVANRQFRIRDLEIWSQSAALAGDLVATVLAFYLAWLVRYDLELGGTVLASDREAFGTFIRPMVLSVALVLIVFPVRGMYRLRRRGELLDRIVPVIGSFTTVIAGVVLLAFFLRFSPSRLMFLYAWIVGIALMIGHRAIMRGIERSMWKRGFGVDRVLIVGEGESGRRIMQAVATSSVHGYQLVGYVAPHLASPSIQVATERGVRVFGRLGAPADVRAIVSVHQVDEVIILPTGIGEESVLGIMQQCRDADVEFRVVPDVLQFSLDRVDVAELGGVPLIGVKDASIRGWNALAKRGIDIAVAVGVLTVFAIPMIVMAVVIKRDSPGSVLYRQTRIGRHGVPFQMLKFRCMVEDADALWVTLVASTQGSDGRLFKIRDDPRLTRSGRWLRRFSLDELPQVLQVLRGEMSVIGPRPPLPREVAAYEDWHHQRLLVKPGLTGLWQVNGRSMLTFDEMVRLDLFYAENWSPVLDVKILLRTIPAVLLGRGAW